MSAPDAGIELDATEAVARTDFMEGKAYLTQLQLDQIVPNEHNPRLDFPQGELNKLAESIDLEGILVPIVVYPKDGKFVLVDGERRYRCALELGLPVVPALVTAERSEQEVLLQMFNIHLIREPWRDVPTALALGKLADAMKQEEGQEVLDSRLAELTGVSVERVRQLRYVVTLPEEWQAYIRSGQIPLNFFWELKRNVIDQLNSRRPELIAEIGENAVRSAFVQKRLDGVITDTVSLRKVAPIIKFAELEAEGEGSTGLDVDKTLRDLILTPDATVDDAYEDTVQMMVEVDKLARRTTSMTAAFRRLLGQAESAEDRQSILSLGQQFVASLTAVLAEAVDGRD